MKFRLHLFIFLLNLNCFVILSSIYAQSDINPFKGVSLDHPLPEIFRAGEIYMLKGSINNFQTAVRLTADIHLLEGSEDYQKISTVISSDGKFALNLNLKYPGLYNLSLKIDYKLIGTKLLKVTDPIPVESKPLLPISHFGTTIIDFAPKLVWQTDNELVQLQIIQSDVQRTYTLSNSPDEYKFDPDEIAEFNPGEVQIRIRGARSTDGSWYTQSSDWSNWQEIKSIFVENILPKVSSLVQFKQSYTCNGMNDSSIKLRLLIKTTYNPNAFIKRPDGRVDILNLKSNKKLGEFSIGGETKELYPESECSLEYFPNNTGTYLVEINDAYGDAVVNIPYYYGNLIPVLPQKEFAVSENKDFDLEIERNKMLKEINIIRQKLGRNFLRLDSSLTALSQYYSDRMATENFCDHVAPGDGEVLEVRRRKFGIIARVAENVAKAPRIDQAFYNLLQSPAHYAAMIDSTATRAGIGISIDKGNHFLIAQHFAEDPFPREKLDDFLVGLFEKMKKKRNELIRIYETSDLPYITKTNYIALSSDRVEKLVLGEKSYKIWGHKSVGQVYFESFTQTIEGFKLEIKYYPPPSNKEKPKN